MYYNTKVDKYFIFLNRISFMIILISITTSTITAWSSVNIKMNACEAMSEINKIVFEEYSAIEDIFLYLMAVVIFLT
jgi:hypothetical protein